MRLTVKEASKKYDIPAPTIYRWLKERRVKHFKRGGKIEIDQKAMEKYARQTIS